jgi:putative zinc finger protein
MLPPDPHDEFQELCALSTTGELTPEESARLEHHLSQCASCRQAQQEFDRLVALTIPALAEEDGTNLNNGTSPGSWSIEEAEAALMESLRDEPSLQSGTPMIRSRLSVLRTVGRYAVAAALVAGVGTAGYWVGARHGGVSKSVVVSVPSSPHSAPTHPEAVDGAGASQNVKVAPEPDQVAALRDQLRLEGLETTRIKETQGQLQADLAARNEDLDRSEHQRTEMEQRLASLQANAESLQVKLDQVSGQKAQDPAPSPSLKAQIGDLNAALQEKNKEIADQQELLEHDRDIRNLIGARNLYIAEIYDVAKNGDTQKPFGRVFYTKDKSLILYGYDLDQQKGVDRASTFQAWGRRGADRQHDVSLGLLYQDDANQKRWVLKLNDAKKIAQIDVVFVTVEPAGGSPKPSGKPFLFTYLRLDPNHP